MDNLLYLKACREMVDRIGDMFAAHDLTNGQAIGTIVSFLKAMCDDHHLKLRVEIDDQPVVSVTEAWVAVANPSKAPEIH